MSRNGRRVNAKSIMGVMMLAAPKGSRVMIETSGPDEDEAMNGIVAVDCGEVWRKRVRKMGRREA